MTQYVVDKCNLTIEVSDVMTMSMNLGNFVMLRLLIDKYGPVMINHRIDIVPINIWQFYCRKMKQKYVDNFPKINRQLIHIVRQSLIENTVIRWMRKLARV